MLKQTMRLKLTFVFLILFSVKIFACSCVMKSDFKTKKDLNEYSFIAHIKINGIKLAENIETDSYVHQMTFEILESYKGKEINNILVYGAHPSLNDWGWTSCDLGERIGDEWIIFGYYDKDFKKLTTGYCTRSERIKVFSGYEDVKYPNQLTLKKKLQQLFDKEQIEPKHEGKRIEYYQNGNKQFEENYENGVLNGQRNLWYPNEVIQSTQNFLNGKKNGVFKWYSGKGNLTKLEKFDHDIPIDTTIFWREIDTSYLHLKIYSDLNDVNLEQAKEILSKRKIWIERIYNDDGKILSNIVFRQNGEKEEETIYYPEQDKQIVRYFHKNGVLSSEMFREKGKTTGIYKDWDENGKLLRSWEYDENGEIIEETRKKY
jgi:antitoxin component YwqK of YwqJK toxin-antitoxin module